MTSRKIMKCRQSEEGGATDTPPVGLIQTPDGYADWFRELKKRIHTAQQRATLAVNRELVLLYWQIGHDILMRQADHRVGVPR